MKKRKPKAWFKLPDNDRKLLARLVGKHGRELIAAAAFDIPLPKKGRPEYSSKRTSRDLADLARNLDRSAAEHREGGVRDYAQQAMLDLFAQEHGRDTHVDVQAYLKTTKKLWAKGRRIQKGRQQFLEQLWQRRKD